MSLSSLFKKLMSSYSSVYDEVTANSDWQNPFRVIIGKDIPNEISDCIGNNDIYKVVGSYGKGRWTQVPWISIFDSRITTSAQHGVYIVYLLNKDAKELYTL